MERKKRRNPSVPLDRRMVATALLYLAMAVQPGFATNPPAPPPPTVKEIVESSEAVYVGRVIAARWKPIAPDQTNAGSVSLEVEVTNLLLEKNGTVPRRITYYAGRANLSEHQAQAMYEGKEFVFAGLINAPRSGPTEIYVVHRDRRPFDLSMLGEFNREIRDLRQHQPPAR